MRNSAWLVALLVLLAACSRPSEDVPASNLNIRLSFTPYPVAADQGTTVLSIDVDNFSGRRILVDDIRIATSAGADKVVGIVAKGNDRFTATLQGLTDTSFSPVLVTVSIGGVYQTAYLPIVSGAPSGITLEPSSTFVNADDGFVDLVVTAVDEAGNPATAPISIRTTAGWLENLRERSPGVYDARIAGLVHTEDSPVLITAALSDAIRQEAPIQILAGVLDHFSIAPVDAQQVANEPFALRISARDRNGNLVTGFEKLVHLSTTVGTGVIGPKAFTNLFTLGEIEEDFLIRTDLASTRILVSDGAGHTGESNTFQVLPSPPNQLLMQTATGFDGIISADGCDRPGRGGSYDAPCAIDSQFTTRLELRLRRYVNDPNEPDQDAALIGGKADDFTVSLRDAGGVSFTETRGTAACSGPCLGPVVEDAGKAGYYYVDVYNLRDQGRSPYTVRARIGSLLAEMDVSVVPGELAQFGFSPVPAQRYNPEDVNIFNFLLTVTALDAWGNRVLWFGDSVAISQEVDGVTRRVQQTPPMVLGQTTFFSYIMADTGFTESITPVRLVAEYGAVRTYSDWFKVVPHALDFNLDNTNLISDFTVFLPGQYGTVPELGVYTSTDPATEQEVGIPFQVLVLARTRTANPINSPAYAGVTDFSGRVLLQGNNTELEVVDSNCSTAASGASAQPAGLTPDFVTGNLGTYSYTFVDPIFGTTIQIPGEESHCFVTVRATRPSGNARVAANPLATSSISPQGNLSSPFVVRSAHAESLRINPLGTPQRLTLNPASPNLIRVRVEPIDEFGNVTDNILCNNLALTSGSALATLHVEGAPLSLTDKPGLEVDVWFTADAYPVRTSIVADCGTVGLQDETNAFDLVPPDVVKFQVTVPSTQVRAHVPFTFSAVACADDPVSGPCAPATTFNYRASISDTTGTMYPALTTAPFLNGALMGQEAYIDRITDSARVCVSGAGAIGCSDPFPVFSGQLAKFSLGMDLFPNVLHVSEAHDLEVTALDAGGNLFTGETLGWIYLNSGTGSGRFVLPDGAWSTAARVLSDEQGELRYCLEQANIANCTNTYLPLRIGFTSQAQAEYLYLHDGRGHSGYSLPATFAVVYGPVAAVEYTGGPCGDALPGAVRVFNFFNFCAVARDAYGNIKRDFNEAGVPLADVFGNPLDPNGVDFVEGVARTQLRFAFGGGDTTRLRYRTTWNSVFYDAVTDVATLSSVAHTVSTASTWPTIVQVGERFALDLAVTTGGVPDADFEGSLQVTSTTGAVRTVCADGSTAYSCGFLSDNGVAVTGAFAAGTRTQSLLFESEAPQEYVFIDNGYGSRVTVGPIVVEGSLHHFDVAVEEVIPGKVPADSFVNVTITARDVDGGVVDGFDGVVKVTNRFDTLSTNPTLLAGFSGGVLEAQITFTQGNAALDRLTVDFFGKQGVSQEFTVEDRALTAMEWGTIPAQWPGYVDRAITITARDQFGDVLTSFNDKVRFTSSVLGYAVRPTTSVNFSSGVLSQKVAVEGPANGTIQIISSQVGTGGALTERGRSSAIQVQASTITGFAFAFQPARTAVGLNCTYAVKVDALGVDAANFSGQVRVRWGDSTQPTWNLFARYENVNPSVLRVVGQTPTDTTAYFSGGTLTFDLLIPQMSANANQKYVNVWINGTAIEGWSAALSNTETACP